MTAQLNSIDELANTVALMRLMHDTGGTVHLTGPALSAVLAEYDRRGTQLTENDVYIEDLETTLGVANARVAALEAMEQRARSLAATQGLDGAARTYAHAGRFVLGVA